jgi:hypothetical protein
MSARAVSTALAYNCKGDQSYSGSQASKTYHSYGCNDVIGALAGGEGLDGCAQCLLLQVLILLQLGFH